MLSIYRNLGHLAQDEFADLILGFDFKGGTPSSPNKLRLNIIDGSFLDIWLSAEGDYAYHWEHRRQSGQLYRWDNAPHYPHLESYPNHFHSGEESNILNSSLSPDPESALRQVLGFVKGELEN